MAKPKAIYKEKYNKGTMLENKQVLDILKTKKKDVSIEIRERSYFDDESETMIIEVKLTKK